MQEDTAIPTSLLVHDGELADVRALLAEIGIPFQERLGATAPDDGGTRWGLLIAPPQRMLRLDALPAATRIAVMSQDSRTLRNSLRRAGIQLLVRRPVHPATMRALVVHALYRGPEKRRSRRVNVGASVTYRVGWRNRPAVLVDLSLGGCRLLTDHRLERDAALTLHLPAAVAEDKAFSVRGSVLRSEPAEDGDRFVSTARFGEQKRRIAEQLRAAVGAHAEGPAVFEGAPPLAAEDAVETRGAVGEDACVAPGGTSALDRRLTPRRQLDRRVITLSDEATRVLVGRDITLGGMRVTRHPALRVGTDLLLAMHAPDRPAPLVVRAKVHRDDHDHGMLLRFHALSREASDYLGGLIDHLPLVEEADGGCLVTEILETS